MQSTPVNLQQHQQQQQQQQHDHSSHEVNPWNPGGGQGAFNPLHDQQGVPTSPSMIDQKRRRLETAADLQHPTSPGLTNAGLTSPGLTNADLTSPDLANMMAGLHSSSYSQSMFGQSSQGLVDQHMEQPSSMTLQDMLTLRAGVPNSFQTKWSTPSSAFTPASTAAMTYNQQQLATGTGMQQPGSSSQPYSQMQQQQHHHQLGSDRGQASTTANNAWGSSMTNDGSSVGPAGSSYNAAAATFRDVPQALQSANVKVRLLVVTGCSASMSYIHAK